MTRYPFTHATKREFVQERPVGQKATKLMDVNDAINKGKDFLENNKIDGARDHLDKSIGTE